jgi:hypothetical protein
MTNRMKLARTATALVAAAALGLPAMSSLAAGVNETHVPPPQLAVQRSTPNGRTDVIKA